MPSSRSAKEICREHGPDSISCKVAKNRERRRKRREEAEGEAPPPETEAPKPPPAEEEAPPPVTDRKRYLDWLERQAGSQ